MTIFLGVLVFLCVLLVIAFGIWIHERVTSLEDEIYTLDKLVREMRRKESKHDSRVW